MGPQGERRIVRPRSRRRIAWLWTTGSQSPALSLAPARRDAKVSASGPYPNSSSRSRVFLSRPDSAARDCPRDERGEEGRSLRRDDGWSPEGKIARELSNPEARSARWTDIDARWTGSPDLEVFPTRAIFGIRIAMRRDKGPRNKVESYPLALRWNQNKSFLLGGEEIISGIELPLTKSSFSRTDIERANESIPDCSMPFKIRSPAKRCDSPFSEPPLPSGSKSISFGTSGKM
ncbi:hypothetical protein KM043_003727 [Ampulex compressa]|nr:hypothetical protein KM043_003727 [Ampulex compressa]